MLPLLLLLLLPLLLLPLLLLPLLLLLLLPLLLLPLLPLLLLLPLASQADSPAGTHLLTPAHTQEAPTHLHARHAQKLPQLFGGEGRLHRAPPPQQMHLLDRAPPAPAHRQGAM